MKIYQIFFTDEYNNNYDLGFFKNLDDAVPAVFRTVHPGPHSVGRRAVTVSL